MSSKNSLYSVTDEPCVCAYLEEAANDPELPILFDTRTAEFQLKYTYERNDGSSVQSCLIFYHCPFCGGAAPESKRDLLYAVVPDDEVERIAQLLSRIRTIEEALEAFGKPDIDGQCVHRYPEHEDEPPIVECFREIEYDNLSEVANVRITERGDGKIRWQIYGKHL